MRSWLSATRYFIACFAVLSCAMNVGAVDGNVKEQTTQAKEQELREKLQGKWIIESTERGGQLEAPPTAPLRITVSHDKLLINDAESPLRISRIDASGQQLLLDITNVDTKQTLEGIFQLTDDTWTVCLNTDTANPSERPTSFDTRGTQKFAKVILKRE